jgi:hypothetical protein
MKSRSCPVRPFLRSSPCGDGQSEVTESCNQNPCLPDPNWSEWGDWSQCSQTCGMYYCIIFIVVLLVTLVNTVTQHIHTVTINIIVTITYCLKHKVVCFTQ